VERALVVGASGGIGSALSAALAARGAEVVGLSRSADGLDVTDEASIGAHLGGLTGPFDTVIVATGALGHAGQGPEKMLRAVDPAALARQFALNAAGPVLVLKHALRLIPKDKPARFAAISARVGSIGDNSLGGWYSYRAAKAALNQLIHTAAIEVGRSHPQAVLALLHPGTVDTPFTANYTPAYEKLTPSQSAASILSVLDRLTPADSGGFFDQTGARVVW
jgi:NAD(P)-dependent dehydrogenase (short-subunit alcohol dehydrogenase family)